MLVNDAGVPCSMSADLRLVGGGGGTFGSGGNFWLLDFRLVIELGMAFFVTCGVSSSELSVVSVNTRFLAKKIPSYQIHNKNRQDTTKTPASTCSQYIAVVLPQTKINATSRQPRWYSL